MKPDRSRRFEVILARFLVGRWYLAGYHAPELGTQRVTSARNRGLKTRPIAGIPGS